MRVQAMFPEVNELIAAFKLKDIHQQYRQLTDLVERIESTDYTMEWAYCDIGWLELWPRCVPAEGLCAKTFKHGHGYRGNHEEES